MSRQDSRHKGPEEGRDTNFQRTVFYGELQEGKRFCGTQSLTDFDIPFRESCNRLHRSDQSSEDSSTKEQLTMKKRESVKLKESA